MRLGSGVAVAVVPAAEALIRPLPWELPYATGATLKKKLAVVGNNRQMNTISDK